MKFDFLKRSPKHTPAPVDNGDQFSRYMQDHNIPGQEARATLFTARLMTVALCMSLGFNVILTGALVAAFPLKQILPYFVAFKSEDSQFYVVQPAERSVLGIELLIEQIAQAYVAAREEFFLDDNIMKGRWDDNGWIAIHTEENEYRRFKRAIELPRNQFRQSRSTVSVTTQRAISPTEKVYQVNFTRTERDANNRDVSTIEYTAFLTVELTPKRLTPAQARLNPLGFTVVNYQVSERKK